MTCCVAMQEEGSPTDRHTAAELLRCAAVLHFAASGPHDLVSQVTHADVVAALGWHGVMHALAAADTTGGICMLALGIKEGSMPDTVDQAPHSKPDAAQVVHAKSSAAANSGRMPMHSTSTINSNCPTTI